MIASFACTAPYVDKKITELTPVLSQESTQQTKGLKHVAMERAY